MGSFKPAVKNNFLPAIALDTTMVKISLHDALAQNGIKTLTNFRFVTINKEVYYQVAQAKQDSLTYIRCTDGVLLSGGDRTYATFLAQRYLSEETKKEKDAAAQQHHGLVSASFSGTALLPLEQTGAGSIPEVLSTTMLTHFTKDFKVSNKILPVYEVAFERKDGIRLYIETGADRLVLASDKKKRWFATFFSLAHSWLFLDRFGKTKSVLLGTFAALSFFTSVSGFAVYNVLRTKKKGVAAGKRWHRALGNVFLLTTLLYSFSGAWHAFAKLAPKQTSNKVIKNEFCTTALPTSLPFTFFNAGEKLTNISMANIEGGNYWQLSYVKEKGKTYINTTTGLLLLHGDVRYATEVACRLKSAATSSVLEIRILTSFNHNYSMMNKRLPVVEVVFADGEKYYIETASGALAAVARPSDKAERFSFSNLHMHHYWEMWLGKESGKMVRNAMLISTTLGLLLLAQTGVLIFIKKKLQLR